MNTWERLDCKTGAMEFQRLIDLHFQSYQHIDGSIGVVDLLDLTSGARRATLDAPASDVAVSADGALIVTTNGNELHTWDASGESLQVIKALGVAAYPNRFDTTHSVTQLVDAYTGADITHRHLTPKDLGVPEIGHFGFFRERFRDTLWQESVAWLHRQEQDGGRPPRRPQQSTEIALTKLVSALMM